MTAHASAKPSAGRFAALTLGAVGVVFGDIGTSPLYAFKVAVGQAAREVVRQSDILGLTSLMLWALTIVVTVKYVTVLMRADNKGEGGILSLMALAQHALGGRTRFVLALGVIGAALFYGDAMITPAISVLSAVEGLRTVPELAGVVTLPVVLIISLAILIGLFLVQSHGTARVAAFFGPVCLLWFASITVLGVIHIPAEPKILLALDPTRGLAFLARHGVVGLFVLGSVSLTITGAEALYADMGHFGAGPIRLGWIAVVFPALALNYFGQGASALHYLAGPGSQAHIADQDWFFLLAPPFLRAPLVILATLATIIASQAVVTGAYSLSSQAIQLGLLPRLIVQRTSEVEAGQIYLPTINFLLMVGVILLVAIFKTSDSLANAYGLAVTGTMAVTTALATIVIRRLWAWPVWRTALVVTPLLAVDLAFFAANSLKLASGAWVSLAMGAAVAIVIVTWIRGRDILAEKSRRDRIPIADFIASLQRRPRHKVVGTAVYLSPEPDLTPSALMHNLKHNGVLHERNVLVTVTTADEPRVPDEKRGTIEAIAPGFWRVSLTFGFMERPDVPEAMKKMQTDEITFDPLATSYFLGRRTIVPSHDKGLRRLQDLLFIAMSRNSANPTDVFGIPPGRVVEMGVQVSV
ncbi:MAG TPA: potassium transporter Kup [Caulobacteraceae bacterium]|nr:potassium transporter Kup [Caulobacteraceae bacterium]